MSTYFNDMQAALDTQLNTLAGGYDIAWPNVDFKPAAGSTFLRASFIPGETVQVSLGGSGKDETNAIYQVDVVSPRGSGRSSVADSIADHFSRGSVLAYNGTKLRVRSVSIGPAINDGAWHFVPVSISVQTYTEAR
jgi:hypothetical protein